MRYVELTFVDKYSEMSGEYCVEQGQSLKELVESFGLDWEDLLNWKEQ